MEPKELMSLFKKLLIAPCILSLSTTAQGQVKAEPTEAKYELGYVLPGQEEFCQGLLTDYEKYAPGNMNEYYKNGRFVQWTSGVSSTSSSVSLGRFLDNVQWSYVPLYNDGSPVLLVRYSDFRPIYFSDAFGGGGGHSLALGDIAFSNSNVYLDVKNAFWSRRLSLDYGVLEPYMSALLYYRGLGAKERMSLEFLKSSDVGREDIEEYIKRDKEHCIPCDYSEGQEVLLRRNYLYQKGFFKNSNEINKINKNTEELFKLYPALKENSRHDELAKPIPMHIKPTNFHEINIIYYRGSFSFFYRKTQSDTAVVFNFQDKNNYKEVCYIGPKSNMS